MTVTAKSTLTYVSCDVLTDPSNKHWAIDQLVRYYNRVQRLIAMYRPDACIEKKTMALAAGVRQSLPSGYLRLLDVISNTSGAVCTMPAGGTVRMDASQPTWRTDTPADDALHLFYDPREPMVFQVWPPATTSASLDLKLQKAVTDITEPGAGKTYADVTGNMSLVDDLLAVPLAEGICYLAYAKDANHAAQASRAVAHYQLFANMLGVEVASALAIGPHTDNAQQASAGASGVVR